MLHAIAMRYDFVRNYENDRRVEALVAKAITGDSWLSDVSDASSQREFFRQKGHATYIKALLSTDDGIGEVQSLTAALVEAAVAESVESQLVGSQRIGLGAAARIMLGTVEAQVVGEGQQKTVGEIAFTLGGSPVKVHAEVLASAEALRALDSATQSAVRQHLVSALARASDAYFVSRWTAAAATTISALDAEGVGTLLDALSGGAPRRPYVLARYSTLLSLSPALRDIREAGVGVVPLPAAPADTVIAIDAAGLAFQDTDAQVSTARHASITMAGSPSNTVSLWQANLAALRAERYLRHEYRPDAIAWGTA
jgi:hypothetical protein